MNAEWFTFEVAWWELALRGTAIYWFLLLVFRFILRRDVGSMSMADLLFLLLVSEAASNGAQGEYTTVGDGIVLISTLVFWNYLLDWLGYHSSVVAKFLEPPAMVIVRHGRMQYKAMKKELITEEELNAKLREQGIDNLSTVKIAKLESDGEISVVKYSHEQHPPPGKDNVAKT
ncbi:YetF domain-containing protein [Comamonadaceae bacterium PP-2]